MPAIRHLFARGARKMAALLDRASPPPAPRTPAPSLPPGKTHEAIAPGLLASPGVEIGAFKTPIPGITPIQVDLLAEFAREPTLAEYMGSAIDLPFEDSSLNYVASSHVIEHVANPLAAFQEWYRVLRHGGVIYMVVEHFKNGDALPIYRRFRDQGRMAPDGLVYVASWVDEPLERCYQIMETNDRALLDAWMARWSDIVDFEVHEVITSAEAAQRIAPRL